MYVLVNIMKYKRFGPFNRICIQHIVITCLTQQHPQKHVCIPSLCKYITAMPLLAVIEMYIINLNERQRVHMSNENIASHLVLFYKILHYSVIKESSDSDGKSAWLRYQKVLSSFNPQLDSWPFSLSCLHLIIHNNALHVINLESN